MIDPASEKEKESSAFAEPVPSSPPPVYLANASSPHFTPTPPPGQPIPQPAPAGYSPNYSPPTGAPGQYGQPGQFGAPGQLPPGQYGQPGQPGHFGYPGQQQQQQQQGYFPPSGQPGSFSPQGQPIPLAPQHTGPLNPQHTGGPLNPQHTGMSGQLSPQTTGQLPPGQYPNPAGYPPQSPPMMHQQQHVSVNYASPNATPGIPAHATGYPVTPQMQQQPFLSGSQFQQELYARCARGEHDIVVKHGVVGIIVGILLFPIGLICLFMDVEKKCSRCGVIIPV